MRNILWIVPIAVVFLNPTFACSDEPPFQYGASEMRAAVEGDWSFAITPAGAATMQVTVHIGQAATTPATTAHASGRAFVRAAHACGTRTLVKSAGACIDISQMPLAISYVSGDATFSTAMMSGTFSVIGLAFSSGDLELRIGPYQILSQVNPDGSVGDPHLGPGGRVGTLTVTRS
jgi:hypothetical protein